MGSSFFAKFTPSFMAVVVNYLFDQEKEDRPMIKEKLVEQKEKVTEFFSETKNRKWLIIGPAIICGVAGSVIGRRIGRKKVAKQSRQITDSLDMAIDTCRKIDSDIYQHVAWSIEQAVLNRSVENQVIERVYDLGDNLFKSVRIVVENVHGD